MAQEIEIEYKTLLSKQQYETLLHALDFPNEPVIQTNYYFETKDFFLKKHHSALRIRNKNHAYTLTLKEPHKEGILETHDSLSISEANKWIEGKPTIKANVHKQLTNIGLDEKDLSYYGSLKTERYSFTNNGLLYVLDKSMYNGITDYELEIEAPTKLQGQKALEQLTKKYKITNQQSITKIERFFTTL